MKVVKTKLFFILLAAALVGCMSQGYRHCVGYMGATYCIDKPHGHDATGAVVTNAPSH
jgi:hypothetical protein